MAYVKSVRASMTLSGAGKSENRFSEQVAGGNALPRAPQLDVLLSLTIANPYLCKVADTAHFGRISFSPCSPDLLINLFHKMLANHVL